MRRLAVLFLALMTTAVAAEEAGFLTDYSLLSADAPMVMETGRLAARGYSVPDFEQRLGNYSGIMVDQPEFFISPDSKYRGSKANQVQLIAEEMRSALSDRIRRGGFNVVEQPGPGVLYLRTAFTNVYLAKKKRGILSYTPVGAVATGIGNATKSFFDKVELVEVSLELELQDSQTDEVLVAITLTRGQHKDRATRTKEQRYSWEGLDALMQTLGERARCRLTNPKRSEAQREDCSRIVVTEEEVRANAAG